MFKIANSPSYNWPVKIAVPDNGKFKQYTFDVVFSRADQAKIDAILGPERSDDYTNRQLASEFVQGWEGVQDEEGNELPFSTTALNKLLNVPGMAAAISRAWIDSVTGDAARLKN
jgi:hypothetical protein